MSSFLPSGLEPLTLGENEFSSSPYLSSRSIGISLIKAAAESRNLKVNLIQGLVFEVTDGVKQVFFFQNSPQSSMVFSYCAKRKHIAKVLLAQKGVTVPDGGVFFNYEEALDYFDRIGADVAVKPAGGSHGTGVSSRVSSREEFPLAWKLAKNSGEMVIVERSISGYDLRVIVIGGRSVAAYVRIPANVTGDGVTTISGLVEQKNVRRKLNPSTRSDPISRFDMLDRNDRSRKEVVEEDERVWLTSVANVSVGGEAVQFIDLVEPDILSVAEKAASAFPGLFQVGVDLIVSESGGVPSTYVIEVNSNPGISDAVFPWYGRPVDVASILIGYIFDTCSESLENCDFQIVPALPYTHPSGKPLLKRRQFLQMDLIKQAAYSQNIKVKEISTFVYRLSYENISIIFYKGIPDKTGFISRKMSRNRKWILKTLKKEKLFSGGSLEKNHQCNQYRLIVVDKSVVAGICGGEHSGKITDKCRFNRKRRDISEAIHPGFIEVVKKTVSAIFSPFFAGIDIVAEDISSSPDTQVWRVNNLVCNPFLPWHYFPDSGLARNVALVLLHALFPDLKSQCPPSRKLIVTIPIVIRFSRLMDWVRKQAQLHCISFRIQSIYRHGVEISLNGTPAAIDDFLQLFDKDFSVGIGQGVQVKSIQG